MTATLAPKVAMLPSARASLVVSVVWVAALCPGVEASAQAALSYAIDEVRQSPFHQAESILYLGPLPHGIGVARDLPIPMDMQVVTSDSSFSHGKVFFATWIAAVTSGVAAYYLYWGSVFLPRGYLLVPAIAIGVLGPPIGATLGGARDLPSLGGSAVGFGVALLSLAVVDPDDNFLAFTIPAAIQAGVTTLIASAFH